MTSAPEPSPTSVPKTATQAAMPSLLYGTAWKKDQTADLVVQALRAGFRGIDTACQLKHYNEALVGVGLQRIQEHGVSRQDVFLQTKFTPLWSHDPAQVPYAKTAPIAEQVAQSFAVSLQNLQTDYVDGLILHAPYPSYAQTLQAWHALEKIQQAGGARQIGISNCYDLELLKTLYAAASIKPAVVQNRFCPETHYEPELRQWCRHHGIAFQSFWSLTANPHLLGSSAVRSLAAKYQRTAVQILFRFLTQVGITPLTGTTSWQHMQEDLAIFEFQLRPEEVAQMNALLI